MVTRKVIELSVDEARQMLVDWYFNVIINDPENTKELIATGFDNLIPVVSQMKDYDVADQIGEFNLGEKIANEHDADIVMVRLNSLNSHLIYDRNDPGCNGPDKIEAAAA
jgi:hypothetical protein